MRRECAVCSKPFEAQRPTAKYCGSTCRTRATRGGIATPSKTPQPVQASASGLVDAVRAELEAADRLGTIAGQHAMELATRIVAAPGMNTGVAALSKQLQAVLAEALQGVGAVADPLDELRARRDRKRAAG